MRGGVSTMMMYCVKCRTKREVANAAKGPFGKDGKKMAWKGTCPVCSTGVFQIAKKDA